jgi:molecular chaperone IbpA
MSAKCKSRLLKKEKQMTTLQKELNAMFDTLFFPNRYTTTFANSGSSYPPYNIIRLSDTETVLEVAVAGFKEDEINVVVENGYLKVSGKKEVVNDVQYVYKGIGTRSFEKAFSLSKDTKITRAEYVDGILSVYVNYEVPEERKPKEIPIVRASKPQYLES